MPRTANCARGAAQRASRCRLRRFRCSSRACIERCLSMDQVTHNKIVSFIWGIADDVLRDLFKRGKYPDVILPMCVIRRMDAVLEPTKQQVLDTRKMLDAAGITEQRAALCDAAGQAFYNTSTFHPARPQVARQPAATAGRLRGLSQRLLGQRPGHPRQLQVPQPVADAVPGRRHRHADQQVPRPRHRPLAGRHRQPLDGHRLRGTGAQVQRGEQRRSGRALDAARRGAPDGEPGVPADRVRDPVRHLPALRLRLRHRRHAHRRRGDADGDRRRARPAGQVPPLRPGDQPRDLRRLQGRHAAEGRRRERRPHRRRCRVVHAGARRLPRPRVRLHARQPALRQELEEGPGSHGRQGRHARPALQGHAPGRGAVARHAFERRANALPRQHGVQDERPLGARQPHRRGAQRQFAVHRRRRPGREQHPPLADRERLARSHCRAAAQPLLQHRHRHLHLGALQPEARAPPGPGAAHRRQPVVQAAAARTSARRTASSRPKTSSASAAASSTSQETPESKIFPNAAFGYWKVTVERPLRLHSQLSLKAIETLRFNSGDEDLRATLYEEFGDDLFTRFADGFRRSSRSASPTRAAATTKAKAKAKTTRAATRGRACPSGRRKKLLDARTWERDGRLVDVATRLRALHSARRSSTITTSSATAWTPR
jgi:hypothetical protein